MNHPTPAAIQARTCIVVPCFNEEKRFDLSAFGSALQRSANLTFVLVNDGSRDGTLGILRRLESEYPLRVRVLDVQPNSGKAEAVRRGMQLALDVKEFVYAGYWDADLATPLDAIGLFASVLDRRPDVEIVFGTRVALLGRQIVRLAARHYSGRIFATAASVVLALPVYDTQCGAKLFRVGERCRRLFQKPFGSRWIFDVEIVARYVSDLALELGESFTVAASRGDIGIYELPLDRWMDVGDSKVHTVDFVRAIVEMAAIYRTYRLSKDSPSLVVRLLAR